MVSKTNENTSLRIPVDMKKGVVVEGGPGAGKTFFLQKCLTILCENYSPRNMSFMLENIKGYSNEDLKEVIPADYEVLSGDSFADTVSSEIRRREDLLEQEDVSNIDEYREAGKRMKDLFVVVDDFGFGEEDADFVVLDEILEYGSRLGVYPIVSSQPFEGSVGSKYPDHFGVKVNLSTSNLDFMDISVYVPKDELD